MANRDNVFYVYLHEFANKTFYIGKGKGKRAFKYSKRNEYWKRLEAKYGLPKVTFLYENIDEISAFELEIKTINEFIGMGIKLCNLTSGGEGLSGFKHSDKTKLKCSLANKGRKTSKEHKDKLFVGLAKYIKENGYPKAGVKLSDKQRKRISESHKGILVGRKNPNFNSSLYLFEHEEIGIIETTLYDFIRDYNLTKSSVYRLISGERKTHKGFKFIKRKKI